MTITIYCDYSFICKPSSFIPLAIYFANVVNFVLCSIAPVQQFELIFSNLHNVANC